jgi:hypothetical protein
MYLKRPSLETEFEYDEGSKAVNQRESGKATVTLSSSPPLQSWNFIAQVNSAQKSDAQINLQIVWVAIQWRNEQNTSLLIYLDEINTYWAVPIFHVIGSQVPR